MRHEIVRLTLENSGLLSRVAVDVFDEPVQQRFLAPFLADARHVMFLALVDGTVVGMGSGVEYFHPDKAPQLWINEIGVSPAFQKRGIGRALTEALVDEALRRGCVFAWLGTATDNEAGQKCFASAAGVEPAQPFLLYEWELEA